MRFYEIFFPNETTTISSIMLQFLYFQSWFLVAIVDRMVLWVVPKKKKFKKLGQKTTHELRKFTNSPTMVIYNDLQVDTPCFNGAVTCK